MWKKIDAIEMMGRSIKISPFGSRIWDIDSGKSYFLQPIKTGNLRFFNYSEDKEIYIFAGNFGAFICPAFIGIEALLEDSGFEKVGKDVIPVPFAYGSSISPTPFNSETKKSKAKKFWLKNLKYLRQCYYDPSGEIKPEDVDNLLGYTIV